MIGLVLEVGPREFLQGHHMAQPERGREFVDVIRHHLEVLDKDPLDPCRHRLLDADADNGPEAPLANRLFDGIDKVLRLIFLNFDVSIPGHAENEPLFHRHPREEHVQVLRDEILQPDKAKGMIMRVAVRNREQPRKNVGHLHPARTAHHPSRN